MSASNMIFLAKLYFYLLYSSIILRRGTSSLHLNEPKWIIDGFNEPKWIIDGFNELIADFLSQLVLFLDSIHPRL